MLNCPFQYLFIFQPEGKTKSAGSFNSFLQWCFSDSAVFPTSNQNMPDSIEPGHRSGDDFKTSSAALISPIS